MRLHVPWRRQNTLRQWFMMQGLLRHDKSRHFSAPSPYPHRAKRNCADLRSLKNAAIIWYFTPIFSFYHSADTSGNDEQQRQLIIVDISKKRNENSSLSRRLFVSCVSWRWAELKHIWQLSWKIYEPLKLKFILLMNLYFIFIWKWTPISVWMNTNSLTKFA